MENNKLHTSDESVVPIAGIDEKAFSTLFHQYKQLVYNVAWTYTEDQKMSEDILQDVFVVLWKNREKVGHIENIGAYLYTAARNRSIRVLKNLENFRETANFAASLQVLYQADHTRQVSENDIKSLLEQALAKLSPQQRKVFELSRLQGFSREQVAEKLHITKSTVSVHLTIAIRQVRTFLINHLELCLLFVLFPQVFT